MPPATSSASAVFLKYWSRPNIPFQSVIDPAANSRETYMKKIKIYCEDLEKMIDEDGCYDADGSVICQTCTNKPIRRKVNRSSIIKKNDVKTDT